MAPSGRRSKEARGQKPEVDWLFLDSDFWLPVSESLTMVGLGRLELPTSRLSGVRSNRLSYRPDAFAFASCLEERETETAEIPLCFRIRSDSRPIRCLGRADMATVRAHP